MGLSNRIVFLSTIDSKILISTSMPQLKQLLVEASEYQDLGLKNFMNNLERQIRIKSIEGIPIQYISKEMTTQQAEQILEQCYQYNDERLQIKMGMFQLTKKYKKQIQLIEKIDSYSWWEKIRIFVYGKGIVSRWKVKEKLRKCVYDQQTHRLNQKRYLPELLSKKRNK